MGYFLLAVIIIFILARREHDSSVGIEAKLQDNRKVGVRFVAAKGDFSRQGPGRIWHLPSLLFSVYAGGKFARM
jgi:hypothetical protein